MGALDWENLLAIGDGHDLDNASGHVYPLGGDIEVHLPFSSFSFTRVKTLNPWDGWQRRYGVVTSF